MRAKTACEYQNILVSRRARKGGVVITALVASCVFFACASARVTSRREYARGESLPRPGRVIVHDFDASPGMSTGRSAADREKTRQLGLAAADALSRKLVEELLKLGMPAERAFGAPLPQIGALDIDGQFLRIDEGSRVKRFVIGFGAGATEVRTRVQVYQITADGRRPLKEFTTVAQGSKKPGVATPIGVGAVAGRVATSAAISSGVGVVAEAKGGVEADAARTAKKIADVLTDLFVQQRWIAR